MYSELKKYFFVVMLSTLLMLFAFQGHAALADNQALAKNKPAVFSEINLIEEIFGHGALQTDPGEKDTALMSSTFERIILSQANNTDLLAVGSDPDSRKSILQACTPVGLAVCNENKHMCSLAGDIE